MDRAYFVGTGPSNDQPQGILTVALPSTAGPVDYSTIVTAAGIVRGKGGQPNAVYLNPQDLTALQLATDGMNRPLIQPDPTQAMSETIAGLRIWATPAVPAGGALVAESAQIVVALRQDATVAVSQDAAFNTGRSLVRVIARTDVGVGDVNGLCEVASATRHGSRTVSGPHNADDDMPVDPDCDAVPSDLRLLAGLGPVTVMSEDGVSSDTLVLVPGLWGHSRRLEEDDAS